ncbi:coagulation factor XIII B chain-like [Diadema antillarum]|uniref:coagulation factor XIII B chain-like n=1 Tax=Diadema antillarum TaxID=105358 RepID=UPI003A890F43
MKIGTICCLALIAVAFKRTSADCTLPSGLDNVLVTPAESSYTTWSRVTISCREGYTQSGSDYSYCMDSGEWSPRIEDNECLAQCKAPTVESGVLHFPVGTGPDGSKTVYDNEEVIQYACADEGTPLGPVEAACENGIWVPETLPTCHECAPPSLSDEKLVRVSPKLESYPANSEVTLSCVDGVMYTAKGATVIYCQQNGEWSPDPTKMTCHDNCKIPDRDSSVYSYPLSGGSETARAIYGFNQVMKNTCVGDKILVGPSVQRCVNGVWLPDAEVTCK